MVRAGDMKMEVTLDRASRDSIKSLVKAIDRLSDAIVNGDDVEALADNPEHVATLRRLVEDVKKRDIWRPRDSSRPTFEESM
jgi:hypothetical protein